MRRAALLIALLAASPLAAREDPEWTACDFGTDPKAGLLAVKRWQELGQEAGTLAALRGDRSGWTNLAPGTAMPPLEACAKALASPDLGAADWPRRVSLLQAQAAHRLAAGDAQGALKDLDAVTQAVPSTADPAEVARTVAVASDLLRGVALTKLGKPADAAQAYGRAAAARPWSGRVQGFAETLLANTPGAAAEQAAVAQRLVLIDVRGRERRARVRFAGGDYAGALADWRRMRPAVAEVTTVYVKLPNAFVRGLPGFPVQTVDPDRVGAAAYAAALAGDAAQGRTWIADAKAKTAALPPVGGTLGELYDRGRGDAELTRRLPLVAVAEAHAAGRASEARSLLEAAAPLPQDDATLRLAGLVRGETLAAPGADVDPLRLLVVLPRYEGKVGGGGGALGEALMGRNLLRGAGLGRNSYSKSRGFLKAGGFKETKLPDGRGVTIQFTGDTSSALATEEMTLLRAADLARADGKPGFVVLDKRDLQRTATMTRNGSPTGPSTPAGYVTQLDVTFVDPARLPAALADESDRAILVDDVERVLGPEYKPQP